MNIDQLIDLLQQIKASSLPGQLARIDLRMGLEPMTAFTDAILAAWTAFWAAFLFCRASGRRPVVLWAWSFVAAAISSLSGVAYHGCRIFLSAMQTIIVWKIGTISIGAAALCLGWAAAIAWLRPAARRVAVVILALEFAGCMVATGMSNSFMVAIDDYVPVVLAILIGCAMHWGARASRLIAAGIILSFIAFGVQVSPLHLKGFDHNDIFHVIQMAAMYALYRGGALLGEVQRD